ncbi:MAG: hypothetical protein A3K90_05550 [Pelodictyon luteolum]|uniref:Uncharacterized protein n=1 Tax=Pelodictyon luteolum TaxID=1100 RepID=A0A165MFF5_PELLU|nr:TorF family putative porin [Pelodictyon luteolum]KZK75185.1 MAG: hypothetical protein A3K90_05550 [Pelodictyon luteolum]
MRKTAKFLTLAVALAATFTGTAKADEGFSIGADVVSSYVWRGTEFDGGLNIQPSLSYTFAGIGVEVGAWGSYAVSETNGTRYKELDLFASVPVGPVTMTVTNYNCTAGTGNTFDFGEDGPNVVELSASGDIDDLSLLAAVNLSGIDTKNAVYCEVGYGFYDKDGFTASAFVGGGSEAYYRPGSSSTDFAVVNTGISVSKDRYTAAYIYNPDSEKSFLTFMASF